MVKTKGGRTLNPADAFRKEQRKKEVARNKIERKFIREGARLRSEPEVLKKELQEVIDIEEAQGTLPKNLKLKKKALQEAYDQAIKRKKEEELNAKMGGPQVPGTAGPVVLRPQDSPYFHPTLNPTGAPPPGKGTAPVVKAPAPSGPTIPVPKAPPLPAGPKPTLPPPPSAPPLPKGPAPGSAPHKVLPPPDEPPPPVLPPPDHPPPGYRLPPPAMPPPGAMMAGGRLPPPPGPPPPAAAGGNQPPAPGTEEDAPPGVGSSAPAQPGGEPAAAAAAGPGPGPGSGGPPPGMPLPPPPGPPPGAPLHPPPPLGMPPPGMPPPLPPPAMPPPGMPPPMYHAPVLGSHAQYSAPALVQPHASAPPTAGPRAPKDPAAAAAATITGASTVAKRVPAEQNKQLLSMVPAALRVKRETAPAKPKHPHLAAQRADAGSGFGLAPRSAAPGGAGGAGGAKAETPASVDQRYLEFMASVADLGAFDG